MNMDHFYNLGINAAITKLAAAPSPAMTGLAKRLLLGGGVGAAGGALLGGEGNRGTGALLGGALGAGGLAGVGHVMRRGLRGGVARTMREAGRMAKEELPGSAASTARAVRQAWTPALEAAEARIFPRFTEQEASKAIQAMPVRAVPPTR